MAVGSSRSGPRPANALPTLCTSRACWSRGALRPVIDRSTHWRGFREAHRVRRGWSQGRQAVVITLGRTGLPTRQPGPRRCARTASTRRWSSAAGSNSSLEKMLAIWASTVFRAIPSRSPIAWFDRPSAISARTSRSRSVRSSSGTRERRPTSTRDDRRIDDRTSLRDPSDRVGEILEVGDPVLEQVADASGAIAHQAQRERRLHVLGEHQDADALSRAPRGSPGRHAALRRCGSAASGCQRSPRPEAAPGLPARAHRRHRPARPHRIQRRSRRRATPWRTRTESSARTSRSVIPVRPARGSRPRRPAPWG